MCPDLVLFLPHAVSVPRKQGVEIHRGLAGSCSVDVSQIISLNIFKHLCDSAPPALYGRCHLDTDGVFRSGVDDKSDIKRKSFSTKELHL